MAIDSAEKRRSLIGLVQFMPVGVTPNAAQDIEWRMQAGWGYSGITASGGGGIPSEAQRPVQMILKPGRWFT